MSSASPLDLLQWATQHKAHIQNLTIRRHPTYGQGLYKRSSSPDSNKDDEARMFIPTSIIISLDLIFRFTEEQQELSEVIERLPKLPTLEPILTLFLLWNIYLERAGTGSKFGSYVTRLPRETWLPITWSEREISLLDIMDLSISHAVSEKRAFLHRLWERLRRGGGWFATVTWEEYILAEAWVSSRTVEAGVEGGHSLVPIIDFANHSSRPNARWFIRDGCDTEGGSGVELIVNPNVKNGEEIRIAYDFYRGSGEQLYRYGFIEDMSVEKMSKQVIVVDDGVVFRIGEGNVNDSFCDLGFLTYRNWYGALFVTMLMRRVHLLPRYREDLKHVHSVMFGDDVQLLVQPLHQAPKTFSIPDLPSLVKTLHDSNTFLIARNTVLTTLKSIISYHHNRLLEAETRTPKERPDDIRPQVWELCLACQAQEKNLLSKAKAVLSQHLAESKPVMQQ